MRYKIKELSAVTRNSINSVIYKGIGCLLSLVSAPLVLKCLGDEKYGVFVSVLSIISWIYYFDFGVGNGLRNKLTGCIAQNDYKNAKKNICVAYCLVTCLALGAILICVILICLSDVSSFFNITLLDENIELIIIFSIGLACINFVFSLVNNIFYALQKASYVSFFNIIAQSVYIIGLLLYLKYNIELIFAVALCEGIAQLVKNISATIYVFKNNPDFRFSLKDFDITFSKGIVGFGLQIFAMQVAALVLNSTDNLIIQKYVGSSAVTPYSFCYKYFSYINVFFSAAITPYWSAYTAAYEKQDYKWIKRAFMKTVYMYMGVLVLTIVAAFVFKPFSFYWLGKELEYKYGQIFFTAVYFILLMSTHVFSTLVNGIGKVKYTTLGTILAAIINIPISIFLAVNLELGVIGVIGGSIASMLICITVYPVVTYKIMKGLR